MTSTPSFFQVTDKEWIVLEHVTGIEIHGQPSSPTSITIHLTSGRKVSPSSNQGDMRNLLARLGIHS